MAEPLSIAAYLRTFGFTDSNSLTLATAWYKAFQSRPDVLQWRASFARLTGSSHGHMTLPQFTSDCFQRGVSPLWSSALFRAVDIGSLGFLTWEMYILTQGALHYRHERDSSSLLKPLRCHMSFCMHDVDGDGSLNMTELGNLVGELCSGPGHVQNMTAKVLQESKLPPTATRISHSDFFSHIMPTFAAVHEPLFTRDFLHQPASSLAAAAAAVHGSVVLDQGIAVVRHPRSEAASAVLGGAGGAPAAANAGLVMDPALLAASEWRGALAADKESDVGRTAAGVLSNARELCQEVLAAGDTGKAHADDAWMPGGQALARLLSTEVGDTATQARRFQRLAEEAQRVLAAQPALVRVQAPVKVFGDIHGQLRDLLALFNAFGFPSHKGGGDIEVSSVVFNGDFVDRGKHQVEVMVLLLALKVMYPDRVWLLRGNHESAEMNQGSGDGFYAACNALLPTAFAQCQGVFSWLPLAALLEQEGTLPVLVLHGGIGDGSWDVRDIEAHAPRPWADPSDPACATVPGWMFNMLWSDPSDTDAVSQMGVHANPSRGSERIVRFGEDVTRTFCARNGLGLIVRSHEMAQEGYKVQHSGRLVTVFSARNYTGALANDSAILLFARDGDGNLRMRAKKLEHWRSEQALAAQAATRSISPMAAALLAAARGGGGMAGGRGGRP